jgi:hypothetical protein
MSAPVRIEHLSECRAALLGRRYMEFILVNGRTPRPQSFCARSPSGQATCEKSRLDSPTAITSATPVREICRARRGSGNGERMLP